MLRTRVIAALIAIPIVAFGVYWGGWVFAAGATVIALIAGWEYNQMMKAGGYKPTLVFVLAFIALLMADTYWPGLRLLAPIITFMLLATLIWQLFQANTTTPTVDWALTLAGGLYIGWGMAHLVGMRLLANGQAWVWLTLLCTWAIDTFAYLVGRKIGEHKLWPRLSPKKSWEGFFAGVVGSLLAAFLVALVFGTPSWSIALLVGLVLPVIDLFGDLSISMMKREVKVKDSSNLFPGHGGFLDRIDSLLMDSIVVFYFALWLG